MNLVITLLCALLFCLQAQVASSMPLSGSGVLHDCHIDVQRWPDNSFNIQAYGTSGYNLFDTATPVLSTIKSYIVPTPIGSQNLILIDIANPAVVDSAGGPDFNDPGKLIFIWGSHYWNTFDTGSPCVVKTPEVQGGRNGIPVTYSCAFQCDA